MQKNKANSSLTLQNHQNHAEKRSKFKLAIATSSKSCSKTQQIEAWHCKIIKIMQKNKVTWDRGGVDTVHRGPAGVLSIWCLYDVCMMSVWCLHDVYMMSIWCRYDADMMSIWCLHDVYMMSLWCLYDVYIWSIW